MWKYYYFKLKTLIPGLKKAEKEVGINYEKEHIVCDVLKNVMLLNYDCSLLVTNVFVMSPRFFLIEH